MQLNFRFDAEQAGISRKSPCILLRDRQVNLSLVRNFRAKRYVLRITADGNARVTIPRRGSISEAMRFVERSRPWLERQIAIFDARPRSPQPWLAGTIILFRGEAVRLETSVAGDARSIHFGMEQFVVKTGEADLRPAVEQHLRWLANKELNQRVLELAVVHSFQPSRVTVRNQRSRWGSCSARGVISLNWRLIQTPEFVRDYIILHELAHLRHMNHSPRFWKEVARICPGFEQAEAWLKQHRDLLR